jgi:hypothetical protein
MTVLQHTDGQDKMCRLGITERRTPSSPVIAWARLSGTKPR